MSRNEEPDLELEESEIEELPNESSTSSKKKEGFFNYVFRFDNSTKAELLNLSQYTILLLIPITLLNQIISMYVPQVDEKKSSFEILVEVLGELVFIMIALFYIHRIISYIPTFSGVKLNGFNLIQTIPLFLVILLSIQTKIGKKMSILVERTKEYLNIGDEPEKEKQKQGSKNPRVEVQQPISLPQPQMTKINTHTPDYQTQHTQMTAPQQTQQDPNFNQFYTDNPTQQQQMYQSSQLQQMTEPMAANEALGGGFSSF